MNLRFVHTTCDTARVPINASDESLTELFLGRSIVECLHDDGFAAGITPAKIREGYVCQ